MKIKLRFSCFFAIGLFCFIIYMGLFTVFSIEMILPFFGIVNAGESFGWFLTIFIMSFVSGGFIFSLFFVKPLLFMLDFIGMLSAGKCNLTDINKNIYTSRNKLKKSFWLYKELIVDLYALANSLEETEIKRDKLEHMKQSWISGVSHDLKTPLSYVTGYSELLLNSEYSWSDEEKNTFLTEINSKGKYMNELIGDLNLSFKLDDFHASLPLAVTTFDLVDFTQRLVADVVNEPRAVEYDLSFHSEEKSATINGDKKLLYRALQNLLINCITHNPPNTKIKVKITHQNDGQISIEISDNGIGMEPKVVENLFTKYYRNSLHDDSNFSGGIGLVIVKNIIEAHGGIISVKSQPSVGTTFHILINSSHIGEKF